MSLYVNGVLIAAANDDATVPAYPTYVQLVGVGASGTASIIDYDNFMFADGLLGTAATGVGASNAVTWTNGVNTTDIYLYMQFTPVGQPPGPWYRLDVGNVGSYTHSVQIPSAAVLESPPIALPTQQPAEVRVQYGAAGSAATLITAPAMPCVLNNSKWEDVWLGTIELPPVVAAQDQTSPAWVFYLQGKCPGSNTPTIDCDGFWLMPADEDSVTLTARSVLGAQVKWQADITSEGRVSCQLLSKADGSLVDTAAVVGQFTLGPGDNLIGVQMEMSDGAGNLVSDIVDLKCTLTPSITPRYTDLRQAA